MTDRTRPPSDAELAVEFWPEPGSFGLDLTRRLAAEALGTALLIVAVEPQTTVELAEATRHPVDAVAARLRELAEEYAAQERGFALREVAGGWRFYTSESCAGMVERWVLDGRA